MRTLRFKFAAAKAEAAIHRMLTEHQRIDLHTILKTCYFADKQHLNLHGRPVFGATYRAMRFGPVPLEIYEMLKGESLWLAEINADHYPWILNGHVLRLDANDEANIDCLSETDIECLDISLERSVNMTFNERTEATHGPDWQAAELGLMRYEDMIDESKRAVLVPYLQENARFLRL